MQIKIFSIVSWGDCVLTLSGILGESSASPTSSSTTTDTKRFRSLSFWYMAHWRKVPTIPSGTDRGLHWKDTIWTFTGKKGTTTYQGLTINHAKERHKHTLTLKILFFFPFWFFVFPVWVKLYLFIVPVDFGVSCIALHSISYNGFGQGLGTSGLSHQEERNPQLYTNQHHKHILFQGLVLSNVGSQVLNLQKNVLTSTKQKQDVWTNYIVNYKNMRVYLLMWHVKRWLVFMYFKSFSLNNKFSNLVMMSAIWSGPLGSTQGGLNSWTISLRNSSLFFKHAW